MTSMERVLTALSHKEPDRVPLFLLLSLHGAKELCLSIKDYFSRAENVVKGQLRLREKFQNDCLSSFFYAPVEIEAWGGEVVFRDDGPPNSGEPFIKKIDDIEKLTAPSVMDCPTLVRVLETTRLLKKEVKDEVPIIGVVISPFSIPVMQLGFEKYLDLMHDNKDMFSLLMQKNESFAVEWANAQLHAGATAICYFDPVSSTSIIPRELYLKTGMPIAEKTISKIKGPTATHFASGRCLSIIDDVALTGTLAIGVSCDEDMAALKASAREKLTLIGNLNGIEMRKWTDAEVFVKEIIEKGGPGGGFILSDNHGEIPFQVSDDVLFSISDAAMRWGQYPLSWVNQKI